MPLLGRFLGRARPLVSSSLSRSVFQHVRCIYTILESIPADKVPLTSDKHPELKRKNFAKLTDDDLLFFRTLLLNDPEKLVTDPDVLLTHNTDLLKTLRGSSSLILSPGNTEEMSEIMKYCHEKNLAVVPQGASTSLVGGSVPVFDEIIINTSLLNQIEDVNEISGTVTCGAGCTIQDLDKACSNRGMMFPVDYNLKQAQLGGVIAADIAGPRSVRYGTLHATTVGLEVVLPDGTILDSMSTMKKDNSGYDLKHMFIGSEGTLGIITKASLTCPPRPKYVNVVMMGCKSFNDMLIVYGMAKRMLGEIISAVEFMDEDAVASIKKAFWSLWRLPSYPFTLIIETAGVHDPHDEEKLHTFLSNVKSHGLCVDGIVGDEENQVERVWGIYERILTSMVERGYVYRFDIGLPQQHLGEAIREVKHHMGNKVERVVGYGHLIDGSLELSVLARQYDKTTDDILTNFVFDFTAKHGGTVSSELGCGFRYRNYAHFSKKPAEAKLMVDVKNLLDPKGICNPYKVFPDN